MSNALLHPPKIGPVKNDPLARMNTIDLRIRVASRAAALSLLAAAVAVCASSMWVGGHIRESLMNRAPPILTQFVILRWPILQWVPRAFAIVTVLVDFRFKSAAITFALVGLGVIMLAVYASILLIAFTMPFWINHDRV
jgi:hypothetical protein